MNPGEPNPEIINVITESFKQDGIEPELANGAAVVAYRAALFFIQDKELKLCPRSMGCRECNPMVPDELDA